MCKTAAMERMEEILKGTIDPNCTCDEAWKSRKKTDPNCGHCNYWDFVLEDMSLFAKEQAIAFAEWLRTSEYRTALMGMYAENTDSSEMKGHAPQDVYNKFLEHQTKHNG